MSSSCCRQLCRQMKRRGEANEFEPNNVRAPTKPAPAIEMISLLGRYFVARNLAGNPTSQPSTKEEPGTMANFVITGKAEQTDESSYTVQSTGEVVTKIQLTSMFQA